MKSVLDFAVISGLIMVYSNACVISGHPSFCCPCVSSILLKLWGILYFLFLGSGQNMLSISHC